MKKTGIGLAIPRNSLDGLNALLEMPGFYTIWREKTEKTTLNPETYKLIYETEPYRQKSFTELTDREKEAVLKLNRFLLEGTYPNLCPKTRKKSLIKRNDGYYIRMRDHVLSLHRLGISVLASSEHSTIRGTINGGGDFIWYRQKDSFFAKLKNTIVNAADTLILSTPLSYAASEPAETLLIESPSTETTLAGKAVVDIGENGLTGILVLEGRAKAKELHTGTVQEIPAGSAAVIIPGYGIGPVVKAETIKVNPWWMGKQETGAKRMPQPSVEKEASEVEPNDDDNQAMRIQPGGTVQGAFSFERSYTDRDRFILDISSSGKYRITFTPEYPDCKYGVSSNFTSGRYSRGETTLIIENLGPKGSAHRYKVTEKYGNAAETVSERVVAMKKEFLVSFSNEPFSTRSSGNAREVQCVKNGDYLSLIPYKLSIAASNEAGQTETLPKHKDIGPHKVFNESWAGYSIQYPENWVYSKQGAYTVIFSGREGTEEYLATVSIQNIASSSAGGRHENVDALINALKTQLATGSKESRIYDDKPYGYTMRDGTPLSGREKNSGNGWSLCQEKEELFSIHGYIRLQ